MVYDNYLKKHKEKKTKLKIFLDSGAMLQGIVTDFDENYVILDACLIPIDKVVSIAIL